ncbi:3-keto-disaccharide hydrolase [Roseiconus lacunae]|uniref:3-keto-disaccharide hydrolase n=1 Tax=Roseiconus lacunae TaxID=2605694 RepID=UPI001E4AD6DA|nr:DUF1080 domain-containing protein [Roseiconus lacunae]
MIRFSMLRLIRTALPILLLAGASMAAAQENNGKGPAYTEPPQDDANYHLMGEFAGRLKQGENKGQTLAIQIRPTKGDQFQAIAFFGGLPGQDGHETQEMRLIGLRSGDNVVLSGGPWGIFVDPKGCNIVASSGKLLGRLKRVNRVSRTLGAQPPKDAVVIFDGQSVDNFVGGEMTENGLLKEGALISPMFQDFDMHVEFRLPYMPLADGQQRGNSGLYLQSRYECQVLDSFGTEKMFNGLGALYRMKAPDLNMAFPPLVWQTYDLSFTAPRWASDGKKIRDAHITSWVNGVKVQDNVALPSKTGAGKAEEPLLLPINIQDHGDPVRFRNIWIVDRGISQAEFPVITSPKERKEAAALEWNETSNEEAAKDDSEQAEKSDVDAKPEATQEEKSSDAGSDQ